MVAESQHSAGVVSERLGPCMMAREAAIVVALVIASLAPSTNGHLRVPHRQKARRWRYQGRENFGPSCHRRADLGIETQTGWRCVSRRAEYPSIIHPSQAADFPRFLIHRTPSAALLTTEHSAAASGRDTAKMIAQRAVWYKMSAAHPGEQNCLTGHRSSRRGDATSLVMARSLGVFSASGLPRLATPAVRAEG
jgi:hypothetical protein